MSDNAEDVRNGIERYYEESYSELQEKYGNDPAVTLDLNYDQAIGNTRRPVFMVRGKNITHEQAVQVLAQMEPLFSGWNKDDLGYRKNQLSDSRCNRHTLRTCLYRQGYSWLSSWLMSDGTIGGNILEFKYPELEEILPQWVDLAKRCPFLDLAVGYTTVNESMCWFCKYGEVDEQTGDYYDEDDGITMRPGPDDEYHVEQLCVEECKRRKEFLKTYASGDVDWGRIKPTEYEYYYAREFYIRKHHKDMHKFVRGCFIIKNGHISMYWGKAGHDKFKEYYDKYNDPYLDGLYGQQIADTGKWHIWSKKDVREAFALKGLPAEYYDIAVQYRFITEIPEDAPILTAEWMRKAHREMCEKWNIPIE